MSPAPGCALPRLDARSVGQLAPEVRVAALPREALQPGVVHLGLGAFARAFLLPLTQAALQTDGSHHWGVAGFTLQRPDTPDALAPQQGLYLLAERSATGERLSLQGALLSAAFAPRARPALAERLAQPQTRIASLTLTEKGYLGAAEGDALPQLLQGLRLRHARGLPPLTVLSLDNLSHNGAHTRRRLLALAEADAAASSGTAGAPGFVDWLAERCRFPGSMVDRIVPATTEADRVRIAQAAGLQDAAPVLAEPYLHWVLEDDFAAGRPAWQGLDGVHLVPDAAGVARFEAYKLRMVNGAHSALAYLAVAAGWATVHEALQAPGLRAFLLGLLEQEVVPAFADAPPPAGYAQAILERFANPALAHRTAQIAMDGSQKLPLRWLPTLRAGLQAGRAMPHLALALAAWVQHQRGHDDAGRAQAVQDPLAAALAAHQAAAPNTGDALALARWWLSFTPVFGDLSESPVLAQGLAEALAAWPQRGAAGLLRRWA